MTIRATEGRHLPVGSTVRAVRTPLVHLLCLEPYRGYQENVERRKVCPTAELSFRNLRVEQPLWLNFQSSNERIARLDDERDAEVGRVGYEINFNPYLYEYEPPRPLEEIEGEIREVEKEVVGALREVGV